MLNLLVLRVCLPYLLIRIASTYRRSGRRLRSRHQRCQTSPPPTLISVLLPVAVIYCISGTMIVASAPTFISGMGQIGIRVSSVSSEEHITSRWPHVH